MANNQKGKLSNNVSVRMHRRIGADEAAALVFRAGPLTVGETAFSWIFQNKKLAASGVRGVARHFARSDAETVGLWQVGPAVI